MKSPASSPIVRAYTDAWNAHDPEAFQAIFAPNGRIVDPFYPAGTSGPGIAESLRSALKLVPDIRMAAGPAVETGANLAFEWTLTGNAVAAEGRRVPFKLSGCDVLTVEDGRVVELHGYFDRAAIGEQMATGKPGVTHAAD